MDSSSSSTNPRHPLPLRWSRDVVHGGIARHVRPGFVRRTARPVHCEFTDTHQHAAELPAAAEAVPGEVWINRPEQEPANTMPPAATS